MPNRTPWLLPGLLFVATTWALNTVLVKYALRTMDPLAFTGLRFLTMTPLAFLLAKVMRHQIRFHVRDLPLLLTCGACGYGLYQYLWIFGLAHTSAFASSLFASLSPLLTLTIVAVMGTERVHTGRWLGAGTALIGVAVFEGVFAHHITFAPGDALTLVAAMLFAIFNVVSAGLLNRYTPLGLVAVTMTIGTLILLPGAIPRLIHQPLTGLPGIDWIAFGFAVIFPILLTYPIWSWGLTVLGAGRASLFQFIVPLIAGVLAIVLLRNRIHPHQIVGAVICISGMAIAQLLGGFSWTARWAERTVSLK